MALPLFTPRAGGGPRAPLAVTRRESPARHVTAAEGGLRAAPHTGRSRAKPGLARRVPALFPRRLAPRGRPSGLQGRTAAPRHNGVRAAPGAAQGGSGPAARPSRGRVLWPCAAAIAWHPARRFEVVHLAAFVAVVVFAVVAAREPVARLVQAAAKPPRRLMACHGACCRGALSRTPHASRHAGPCRGRRREGDRRGKRLKKERQLELRRRPAATRRRGDRMGSAISETSRSGPQAVKDARSARLVEPVP